MGRRRLFLTTTAMACLAAACGSGNSGMPPSPPVAGSTITITSSGVSPKNLLVTPGTQATFMNSDSREHEMTSDPHPEHTDCPAINTVDLVVPGQSKQTSNLNSVRTCGYHDHRNPENAALRGTITIQ
jgi:plastocyanin